jgi:hypothetical protein
MVGSHPLYSFKSLTHAFLAALFLDKKTHNFNTTPKCGTMALTTAVEFSELTNVQAEGSNLYALNGCVDLTSTYLLGSVSVLEGKETSSQFMGIAMGSRSDSQAVSAVPNMAFSMYPSPGPLADRMLFFFFSIATIKSIF